MSKYFDNIKWIITGQIENCDEIETKIEAQELNFNNVLTKSKTDFEIELECVTTYDTETEFENVQINDSMSKNKTEHIDIRDNGTENKTENINIEEIKNEYLNIESKLIKNEQLVRTRLNSDTIELIKSNCEKYVNDDIKIIKDFAIIIESFNHIKEKLILVETEMKIFESDIKTKTINQEMSNVELDNRITTIDKKINNTSKMIKQMNYTIGELMKKIVQFENVIMVHSAQRNELLSKYHEIELTKSNCLNYFVNGLFGFTGFYFNNNMVFKTLFGTTCVIGSMFVFKYIYGKK